MRWSRRKPKPVVPPPPPDDEWYPPGIGAAVSALEAALKRATASLAADDRDEDP